MMGPMEEIRYIGGPRGGERESFGYTRPPYLIRVPVLNPAGSVWVGTPRELDTMSRFQDPMYHTQEYRFDRAWFENHRDVRVSGYRWVDPSEETRRENAKLKAQVAELEFQLEKAQNVRRALDAMTVLDAADRSLVLELVT